MTKIAFVTNFLPLRFFSLSISKTWEEVDLTIHDIPPTVPIEIILLNKHQRVNVMGVRSTTSSLERKAPVSLDSPLRMMVNSDEKGRIEAFTEDHEKTEFNINGYWLGKEYVELWKPLN